MLKKILDFLKKFLQLSHSGPEVKPIEPPKPIIPEVPESPDKPDTSWFSKEATDIVQRFEGNVPWANVTGNFDGAYLTCGALGFTWLYAEQPTLVKRFAQIYGQAKGKELMPQAWSDYFNYANMDISKSGPMISAWSNGAKVKSPYYKELTAFWQSPEMIKIQVERINETIHLYAIMHCMEMKDYLKLPAPVFMHYLFYFDQAVLNGQGKTVPIANHTTITENDVLLDCDRLHGFNQNDLRKNKKIWSEALDTATEDQKILFKLGYLRAIRSRSEFIPTVMNRRCSIALKKGYVNGELKTFNI